MEKLLTFNVLEDKLNQMKAILVPLGITINVINPKDYGQTLGYLCGIDGFGKTRVSLGFPLSFNEEMLVFSGVTQERLEVILDALEEAAFPSVKRKAVVTIYNVNWTASQLYNEISKEAGL
ncbi:MAG: DUF3783 domain-containing protein [Pseudobutyrivibrio sp.]|nr:DUF3783 domain-containing protein [Pseudobutyrivibrio sp.]